MEPTTRVLLIVLAAAAGEGIIEFIPVPIIDLFLPAEEKRVRTVILNLLSALLGVGLAINFELSVFSLLGAQGNQALVDAIVTGVLIGRGSNFIHGFIKNFIIQDEYKE